jgi:DNA-binding response OmpR family regulator
MVVEDTTLIAEFVERRLQREGYEVIIATTCCEALSLLPVHPPDLVVLDLVLSDGSGCNLCRTIRQGGEDGQLAQFAEVPILILTARADEEDRLDGFRSGADDYVTKPFSPDELVLRIEAILRRCHGLSRATTVLGPLVVDPLHHVVAFDSATLDLAPKEFDLLRLLASNPDRVFTREELFRRVWGYSFLGGTRTVDVHVNRLRQKLQACGLLDATIVTERGVGYKLDSRPLELRERSVGQAA